MRKSYLTILLILAAGTGAGWWVGARSSSIDSKERAAPVPVGVSPAALYGLGNVQAYNSVLVRAQVDGQITEVAFKEGQELKNGRAGIRKIDIGNIVHANDANGIVTITQTRPISVLFTLPKDTLQEVAKTMAAGGGIKPRNGNDPTQGDVSE